MALAELTFADPKSLDGRNFDCHKCSEGVKKIRRCQEDRWDFTKKDGNIWPMQVTKGGDLYGFCPAKSTWDSETVTTFRMLVLAAETGVMWNAGGISEQPYWFVDILAWFIPMYDNNKFYSRARAILGDGKDNKGASSGANQRPIHNNTRS